MKKLKMALLVSIIFLAITVMALIYILFKTVSFVFVELAKALFSDKGVKKLMDNIFYGSIFVIILHASEVSTLTLAGPDLAIFIGLTLLLKPLEKLIIKS
jgi:uncharacterized membrane protein